MPNPNIVQVSDIRGKVVGLQATTSASTLVENTAASGKILKINTVTVANTTGTKYTTTVAVVKGGTTSYQLAPGIGVPGNATLTVVSKDTSLYLEEGDSITVLASNASSLEAICSYEEIS